MKKKKLDATTENLLFAFRSTYYLEPLKIKFAAGKIYGEGDRVQPFKEPASTAATRNKVY